MNLSSSFCNCSQLRATALGVPLEELRGYDQHLQVREIREITEKDPQWAVAFRQLVDAAGRGCLTPNGLVRSADPEAAKQGELPIMGI
jgi:hypothetical protein